MSDSELLCRTEKGGLMLVNNGEKWCLIVYIFVLLVKCVICGICQEIELLLLTYDSVVRLNKLIWLLHVISSSGCLFLLMESKMHVLIRIIDNFQMSTYKQLVCERYNILQRRALCVTHWWIYIIRLSSMNPVVYNFDNFDSLPNGLNEKRKQKRLEAR